MNNILIAIGAFLVGAIVTFLIAGGGDSGEATGITPQQMTDAVHIVLESDRTVYTKEIVNRLVQRGAGD